MIPNYSGEKIGLNTLKSKFFIKDVRLSGTVVIFVRKVFNI